MNKDILSIITVIIFSLSLVPGQIMSDPFSFTEIQQIHCDNLKAPSFVTTPDNCTLAYYPFVPKQPKALVIFYHGAGLYGNHVHQWIAQELETAYNIGTLIVDIRGHGNSGGPRGDAPDIQTVWQDVSVMIDQVRSQYPDIPLYLAGHSSGAGLLLNYAAWSAHKKVDGLILLAPYLGPLSGVLKEHTAPTKQFAKKIRSWVYIIAGITNGRLCAHTPAVIFNYPDSVLQDEKIVRYYTYTMSCATTPYQTKAIFEAITLPTSMIIADEDEQFIAEKIAQYADYLPSTTTCFVEIIPHAKHLTLLLQAPQLINTMVDKFRL